MPPNKRMAPQRVIGFLLLAMSFAIAVGFFVGYIGMGSLYWGLVTGGLTLVLMIIVIIGLILITNF